jgi:hypothetical protein
VRFNAVEFSRDHPDEKGLWPREVLPGLAGAVGGLAAADVLLSLSSVVT